MRKRLVIFFTILIFLTQMNVEIWAVKQRELSSPQTVLDFINEDMSELYGLRNYYPQRTGKGELRRDLIQKKINEGIKHFTIVYGNSHGPWLNHEGGMFAYSGYTRNGDSVSTEGAPWYAGWSGRQIQSMNLIKFPWEDTRVKAAYDIRGNEFNKYTNTEHPYLQDSNGTFEKVIIEGLNDHYAGREYSEFIYDNLNMEYATRKVYTKGATPTKGGQWIDYVHVLQPPTFLSWGEGRVYIAGSGGRITYLGIPIAPFILQIDDLSAQFETLPSGAVAGQQVTIGIKLHSTFKDPQSTDYIWGIAAKDGSALNVDYYGHASDPSGEITIQPGGDRVLYATFTMPESDVIITFVLNESRDQPVETYYGNNGLNSNPYAVKLVTALPTTVGEFELDYNVLSRKVRFPLTDGTPITASLTLPSQSTWEGPATGSLQVQNQASDLYRSFTVHDNPPVNEYSETIVRTPTISATLQRKDFGDDPQNGIWRSPSTPARQAPIHFSGNVSRDYTRSYTVCYSIADADGQPKQHCETVYEPGSTSAPFQPGSDERTIRAKIYNGQATIPAKVYRKEIEHNQLNALQKNLFWTSEPYRYHVVRWMAHMDEQGQLSGWTPVNGQYQRIFTQQARGQVTWSNASTMEEQYSQAREAARNMKNQKSLYDKAVFATDRELQKHDYPIKSGYYFNPVGVYTFEIETETFKPTTADTKDHQDLVDALIRSFRYETDLIYINSDREAVNLRDEPVYKSGNHYERKPAYISAEHNTGVSGASLLNVIDRHVEPSRYSKQVEEIQYSQDRDGYTHEFWKRIIEGYSESGTLGSRDNYKYQEYVKNGQHMYKIKEKTTVTIVINQGEIDVYTHAQMPDGEYYAKAWIADIDLSEHANAYNVLGTLQGIQPLDQIQITVKGSMYDDLNN